MAIEQVKEFFKKFNMEEKIMEFDTSSATVELAAQALNVIPARIAKTLSFKKDNSCILVLTSGDVKINNPKFKAEFGMRAKMPSAEEVLSFTGHAAGGVCPFAVTDGIPVYLDISLKRFDTVFPACGSGNSAIELTCDDLFRYSGAEKWVDVCKEAE
ncbi:YbaK/EbsC family protein [Sebaldella sp. S0638]|uniref:YbaK/EbsC family protein n=1 Tax=Sebaldella sp. S0638 TaxID=2957809 RepID=UPI0020A032F3|nr:YbaK/EbsC family protein [Sebaldella sp. S0638]MCP1225020.1 YbaK/EbsC family protein [Sebaldella sp. S0638]